MSHNISLAIIPVFLAFIMVRMKTGKLKLIIGITWLAFLPNTIYMLTDINHLLEQWNQVDIAYKSLLVFQYGLLMAISVITFIAAQYPFERILKQDLKFKKFLRTIVICVIDFFVAFGVILGGIERVNSWEILTNPISVLESISTLFHSNPQIGLVLGFGGLFSIIYFSFREFAEVFWTKLNN